MKRLLLVVVFCLLLPTFSWGLATTMEFGVRGVADDSGVRENYSAVELYYQKSLPWKKEIAPGVMVFVRFDAGVAYLQASEEEGGWLAAGGDIVFSLLDGFWEIEAGWRPTVLFEDKFGADDLGGPVQFSSHIGTTFYLGDVGLSYRFVHISNAGIYKDNPGLDLHLVGAGMRF